MDNNQLTDLLRRLARQYETADFINGDPSWFMHQVSGRENQETMGFLASILSYGRRDLFLPKIQYMLSESHGDIHSWVLKGLYSESIPDNGQCYYRLYNNHMMRQMLQALQAMLCEYGSIGEFVRQYVAHPHDDRPRRKRSSTAGNPHDDNSARDYSDDGLEALIGISQWFQSRGIKGMVPAPLSSVAKRPCMYLRWMVRDGSPVDLGLWSSFIDKRSIFIPMDTHVLQEARHLELVGSKTASWHTVESLTDALRQVFPDDPTRGDFALFGYGVNQ